MDTSSVVLGATRLALLACALGSVVHAEVVCLSCDTTGWTQSEKNLAVAVAYHECYEAGVCTADNERVPYRVGSSVCLDFGEDPPVPFVACASLYTEIQANIAASEQAALEAAALQAALQEERESNNVCGDRTLEELDAVIDAAVDTIDTDVNNLAEARDTLAALKQLLRVSLKQVTRCIRASVR